jgi:low affinity Fe/Cu permease
MATLPREGQDKPTIFDRFADKVNAFSSKAWFFAFCVLMCVVWAPSYFLVGDIDTWQLLINTPTTVITFLLVALQQNAQTRSDAAIQQKLNAMAAALLPMLYDIDEEGAVRELRAAVGLEDHESST